jgi:hypothetical protein
LVQFYTDPSAIEFSNMGIVSQNSTVNCESQFSSTVMRSYRVTTVNSMRASTDSQVRQVTKKSPRYSVGL